MVAKAFKINGSGQKTSDENSDPKIDSDKNGMTGTDSRTGKSWSKLKSWFGCGLHLIADARY